MLVLTFCESGLGGHVPTYVHTARGEGAERAVRDLVNQKFFFFTKESKQQKKEAVVPRLYAE